MQFLSHPVLCDLLTDEDQKVCDSANDEFFFFCDCAYMKCEIHSYIKVTLLAKIMELQLLDEQ
jgi:hypothetical protein